MTEQCHDLGVVELYLRKIDALGLGAEQAEGNDTIESELDYTLTAAIRHLSIWGPGIRAVNLKALSIRLDQTLEQLPVDHVKHRQVLKLALDYLHDCVLLDQHVAPRLPQKLQQGAK